MDHQDVSAELHVPPNAAGATLTQVIPEIPSHTVSQAGTFFGEYQGWGISQLTLTAIYPNHPYPSLTEIKDNYSNRLCLSCRKTN